MLLPKPATMTASALSSALASISQPRAVLDADDIATQAAVFLEAVRRNGHLLNPKRTSLKQGLANANTLRKKCQIPRSAVPDVAWLAIAMLQLETGAVIVTEDAVVAAFASSLGYQTGTTGDAAIITDASQINLGKSCKQIVTILHERDDAKVPNRSDIAATVMVDDHIMRYYTASDIPEIRIQTTRGGDLSEISSLDVLVSRQTLTDVVPMLHDPKSYEAVNDVYDRWAPSIAFAETGRPHPSELVISKALASIVPPRPRFTPILPRQAIETGAISDAQYEITALAKDAHARIVPACDPDPAYRMGFLIADGTGSGKTISSAATIADNWAEGRRRHIYVTEKDRHLVQLENAITKVGLRKTDIFQISSYPTTVKLPKRDGILFMTYADLRAASGTGAPDARDFVRLNQVIEWMGPNFDGVIVFDESHNLRNAFNDPDAGDFGSTVSLQGIAGVRLEEAVPMARVLYVSATGATDAYNLGYMRRLRLWGTDTPFATADEFIDTITRGGVAALEAIAAHLYSCGLMACRNLSFEGVSYRALTHVTTQHERDTFDAFMKAIAKISRTIDLIRVDRSVARTRHGNVNSKARGGLEAMAKRITEMLYSAYAMPSIIADMNARLADGEACVVQIMNTYESLIDLPPTKAAHDQICDFMNSYFPTVKMIRQGDSIVPQLDHAGNPIEIPGNVALHAAINEILANVSELKSPIDQIFDAFGTRAVAEITGRSRRSVPPNGDPAVDDVDNIIEERSATKVTLDLTAFNNDHKQILLFSLGAGGSSLDYHSAKTIPNQRRRNHYVSQAGYQADRAVQGLGRTHRANQAIAPTLIIASTDLPGQKAYRSQIMQRIAQLGAIGQGHREAATNSAFNPRDTYQGPQANAAWQIFFKKLGRGDYPEINLDEVIEATSLPIARNGLGPSVSIHRVLNRMARCPSGLQTRIFRRIDSEIDETIAKSIIDRTYDAGPSLIPGKIQVHSSIAAITDDTVRGTITLHNFSGAAGQSLLTFAEAFQQTEMYNTSGIPPMMYRSRISASVWLELVLTRNEDPEKEVRLIVEPHRVYKVNSLSSLMRNRDFVNNKQAFEDMWNARIEGLNSNQKQTHIIASGALPLIWKELGTAEDPPRLIIAETDTGKRIIGTLIDPAKARLLALQPNSGDPAAISDRIEEMHHGLTLVLANGWLVNRQMIGSSIHTVIHVRREDAMTTAAALRRISVQSNVVNDKVTFYIRDNASHDQILADVVRPFPIIRADDVPDYKSLGL